MSRAFLRESDLEEKPVRAKLVSPLPPGAKNYMTEAGAAALKAELTRLVEIERPAEAQKGTGHQELESLDARIRYLQESIRTAEVVGAAAAAAEPDRVRFGAWVRVRDKAGEVSRYRLVGVDETDFDRGWISYLSPIGQVLMNGRVGQKLPFRFPSGFTELEITGIDYADSA